MFNRLSASILATDVGGTIPDGNSTNIINNVGVMKYVVQIFALIGVVILLITLWRAVQAFLKGDFSKVAKTILGGFAAVLLCFNLNWGVQLVNSFSGVASSVIDTITKTLNG
jgi:predicted exporter